MYHSIRPGKVWYDTEGNRIQAHGGSILYVDGVYYWYGENKEGITGHATGEYLSVWHRGVNLYASKDLYNWEPCGTIMVDNEHPDSPFYPVNIMDRPHILHNKKTGKFLLWAKCAGRDFNTSVFGVCIADSIKGPFTYLKTVECTPYFVGDFDLVEFEGKAYAIYEHPHTKMICQELTDDYTDVIPGTATEHLPRPYPPFTREAPAYFRHAGKHYLLTSGTTGYFPNPSELHVFDEFHGEWTDLGDPCVGDRDKNSFCAQFSSVFKHPTVEGLYIALGDRWLTDLSYHMPDIGELYERIFNPAKEKLPKDFSFNQFSEANTSEADYVWLPICFREDGTPYLEWRNTWTVEEFMK